VSRESARWGAGGVPRFLCGLRFFRALRIGGAGAGRRARQRRRCDMHAMRDRGCVAREQRHARTEARRHRPRHRVPGRARRVRIGGPRIPATITHFKGSS